MAWEPIKMKQRGPSPFWRNVISRVTSAAAAIALLYGSYRSISWWSRAEDQMRAYEAEHNLEGTSLDTYRHGGTDLPLYFGIGLAFLGVCTFAGAVMPTSFFERFARPPGDVDETVEQIEEFRRRF